MKKIYSISLFAAILTAFISCENYNDKNFPGYDQAAVPKNVTLYTYEMTGSDYGKIAKTITKPIDDQVTQKKALLKAAKTKVDSTKYQFSIDSLNKILTTDSVYIKATYIQNNKFLNSKLKGKDYIPLLLNQNYIYADIESLIKVTYDCVDAGDTLAIPATSRFTLSLADYDQMGTGTNKNFSSSTSITTLLNTYLKNKCPFALANEVKVVSYMFYDSNKTTKKQYRILTFDGQNWKNKVEQYIFNGKEWLIDPTIYITQTTNDRSKDADGYPADLKNMYSVIVHAVKNNESIKKYISSFKNDEYYYGASAYQGNFSFQYSTREAAPYSDPALIALSNESDKINLMFNRVNEAIIIYLKYTYPDLKPTTTDGLNQYLSVTYKVYERYPSGTNTNTYQAKFQCTGSNPATFKFIERKKL